RWGKWRHGRQLDRSLGIGQRRHGDRGRQRWELQPGVRQLASSRRHTPQCPLGRGRVGGVSVRYGKGILAGAVAAVAGAKTVLASGGPFIDTASAGNGGVATAAGNGGALSAGNINSGGN